jgi:hypothetical protein
MQLFVGRVSRSKRGLACRALPLQKWYSFGLTLRSECTEVTVTTLVELASRHTSWSLAIFLFLPAYLLYKFWEENVNQIKYLVKKKNTVRLITTDLSLEKKCKTEYPVHWTTLTCTLSYYSLRKKNINHTFQN